MIKILQMTNGDSIIAEIVKSTPDETTARMPMRMDSLDDINEDVYFVKLTDLLMYSEETDIVINNNNIMFTVPARQSVQLYYDRAVFNSKKIREILDVQLEKFLEIMDTIQYPTSAGNDTRH